MQFVADIGNTSAHFALMRGFKVIKSWRLETQEEPAHLRLGIRRLLKTVLHQKILLRRAIICSVVPDLNHLVVAEIKRALGVPVFLVGKDIIVSMVNRYRVPHQVGQDRLVGAFAAKHFWGAPCLVIDLGTAITFDVVSRKGEYLGGSIVPGIRLSAESLHKKTALLPKIRIRGPKEIIGRTTEESILSGIFFGFGALCSQMVRQLSKRVGGRPKVILTGGHAKLMRRYLTIKINALDEDLVFKGLVLLDK